MRYLDLLFLIVCPVVMTGQTITVSDDISFGKRNILAINTSTCTVVDTLFTYPVIGRDNHAFSDVDSTLIYSLFINDSTAVLYRLESKDYSLVGTDTIYYLFPGLPIGDILLYGNNIIYISQYRQITEYTISNKKQRFKRDNFSNFKFISQIFSYQNEIFVCIIY